MTASPIFATTAARPVVQCQDCADFDLAFGRTGICISDKSTLQGYCVAPRQTCPDARPVQPKQRGKK